MKHAQAVPGRSLFEGIIPRRCGCHQRPSFDNSDSVRKCWRPIQAAKLASDVAAVGADADLAGLDAVATDEEFLRTAGQQIRGHAEACPLSQMPVGGGHED